MRGALRQQGSGEQQRLSSSKVNCRHGDSPLIINSHHRDSPQTQEEEEGDEQCHQGDEVTQEVDDEGDLVVHLALLLRGERERESLDESWGGFSF